MCESKNVPEAKRQRIEPELAHTAAATSADEQSEQSESAAAQILRENAYSKNQQKRKSFENENHREQSEAQKNENHSGLSEAHSPKENQPGQCEALGPKRKIPENESAAAQVPSDNEAGGGSAEVKSENIARPRSQSSNEESAGANRAAHGTRPSKSRRTKKELGDDLSFTEAVNIRDREKSQKRSPTKVKTSRERNHTQTSGH